MRLWIVVPVKSLACGKSRLAAVLDAAERRSLNEWLLRRTLAMVGAVSAAARVAVVSADEDVLAIAASGGACPIPEAPGGGLNEALAQASRQAATAGADAVMMVPTDLPRASAADLAMLAGEAGATGAARSLVVVPDAREAGTNALVLAPPDPLAFCFGPGSYSAHLRYGRSHGFTVATVRSPTLAFDLDTPDDYDTLARSGIDWRTE